MNEESLFAEAMAKKDEARAAILDLHCKDDVELRKRLEALLRANDDPDPFLDAPAPVVGPTVDDPANARPGTVIGPYKLLEQIGEGGFGVVFMAEQSKPIQRKVALKIIKPGMDTRQVITRFEAERQALALMDHPNIAKVLEAGMTDNGRPYFVMELVRGVPVTDYCDQKSLSIRERLGLFIMICQAVQHAHQKGIIHRDIKPTNVLVTQQDGRPLAKVIDFGVAKATGQKLTEKTLFTGFAQLIGTPLYMSPEQAELSAQDVDTRTDIYSLGVLLYELLTGATPFDKGRLKNATFDELRRIIREEEPPRPSTRLSTLAQQAISTVSTQRSSEPRHLIRRFQGELDWIVMKALEKDRSRRYETASALAADVDRYLRDEPVQACPPSGLYRARKFVRRNSVGVAMATAIGVGLLIAVASAAWVLRDRSAREAAMELEINQALKDSKSSYESGRLAEAMSALKRAEGLVTSGGAGEVVQQRVEGWRIDLATVDRLEQNRIEQAGRRITARPERADSTVILTSNAPMDPIVRRVGSTDANSIQQTESRVEVWDQDTADRAYQQEFERYGIHARTLDIEKAAQLIRNSPIKQALVAALDDWFHATQSDKRTPSGRRELLQIARLVDPDPWRDRLRDAIQRGDDVALTRLAKEAGTTEQPLPTVLLLVRALQARDRKSVTSEGAAILRQVQRRHPNDFWTNVELANCLPKEQIAEEVVFRRIAVALRPDSASARVALAERLQDQGNDEEANALYGEAAVVIRTVIRLNPNDISLYNQLGNVLKKSGKLAEAETALREAIRVNPRDALGYFNLGDTILKPLGKLVDAEAAYREAIRLNPDFTNAYVSLAITLELEGKDADAESPWRDAIRLDPKTPDWSYRLGHLLLKQRKYADGSAEILKAVAVESKTAGLSWDHYIVAIEVLQSLAAEGKTPPDELAADFVRVMDLIPDDRGQWSGRTEFFRRLGRWDDVLNRVAKLRPQETALWVGRGQYRAMHGQWHEALSDFARVLNDRIEVDTNWETINYAGLLILDGDIAGYKGFCQRLKARVGDHPADAWVAYIVSQVLAIGATEAADTQRVLEWAERGTPKNPTYLESGRPYNLGLAQFRAGHYEAAIESLQKATDLGYFPVLGRLVQAMVYDRWGQHPGMRYLCIEETKRLVKLAGPSSAGDEARINPIEWIELNVLAREAETLLKSDPWQANARANDAPGTTENQSALAQRNAELDAAAADLAHAIDLSEDNRDNWSPRKEVCFHISARDEILDRVAKLRPNEKLLWISHGQHEALGGHWHRAAADYAHVIRDLNLAEGFTHEYAGLLILDGDVAGYKRFCQELKARLERQPNDPEAAFHVSRAFAIGPADAVDAPRVEEWAKQALQRGNQGWSLHNLGLAQYRTGQNEPAIENLQKAAVSGWEGPALDWLVQAMVHDRLGHTKEVRRCVDKANELIKMAQPGNGEVEARLNCPDWIELNVLRREAEKLLNSIPQNTGVAAPQDDAAQATENKQTK